MISLLLFLSEVTMKAVTTMRSLNLMTHPQQTAVILLMTAVAVVLPAPAAVIIAVNLAIQRSQTVIMNGNQRNRSQRRAELTQDEQT